MKKTSQLRRDLCLRHVRRSCLRPKRGSRSSPPKKPAKGLKKTIPDQAKAIRRKTKRTRFRRRISNRNCRISFSRSSRIDTAASPRADSKRSRQSHENCASRQGWGKYGGAKARTAARRTTGTIAARQAKPRRYFACGSAVATCAPPRGDPCAVAPRACRGRRFRIVRLRARTESVAIFVVDASARRQCNASPR